MSFVEAVRAGWAGYVDFAGRSSRSAYWWWALFAIIVSVVATILDQLFRTPGSGPQVIGEMTFQGTGLIAGVAGLVMLLPGLAVAVRRLHDTSRSGWWILINVVPLIGWIIFLIFMLTGTTPAPNKYGPVPAEIGGGHGFAPQY